MPKNNESTDKDNGADLRKKYKRFQKNSDLYKPGRKEDMKEPEGLLDVRRQVADPLPVAPKKPLSSYDESDDVEMTFTEHLEELRRRFIRSLVVLGVFFVIALVFSDWMVDILQQPYISLHQKLITTRPTGAFLTRIKVSFTVSFIFSFPFILHQVWLFVVPALSGHLRRFGTPILLSAFLLFSGGVVFNFLIVLPLVLRALIQFVWNGVQVLYNIDDYYDFITMTSLLFGAIFEMPVIVLFLVRLGLLTYKGLARQWRISLVSAAVIAALLTPPDAVSQILMLAPMMFLYSLSIGVAYLFRRRDLE